MRVFLDTNVVVSGFTTRGLCADLVREVLAQHTLITSEHILAETKDVLLNRFGVPRDTVTEIIALLRRQEIAGLPDPLPAIKIRDPEDLAVVAPAIGSHVDFLVTGDKDITSLAPLQQVRIATPREFWNSTSKRAPGSIK